MPISTVTKRLNSNMLLAERVISIAELHGLKLDPSSNIMFNLNNYPNATADVITVDGENVCFNIWDGDIVCRHGSIKKTGIKSVQPGVLDACKSIW